jgi:GDP-D-mannose 3',5'-epimerase
MGCSRSFLYIDECVERTIRLLRDGSGFAGPLNIGSEEMVTINQLTEIVADIAGKRISRRHVNGPQSVRGRNSDNRMIQQKLNWAPSQSLRRAWREHTPGLTPGSAPTAAPRCWGKWLNAASR